MSFFYSQTGGVSLEQLHEYYAHAGIEKEQERLQQLFETQLLYSSQYASLAVPFDQALRASILDLAQRKQVLYPTILVVVGIGGSSLGAKAVYQAATGRLHARDVQVPTLYFAETVDADRMFTILRVLEAELSKGNNVLINVITKSGTTTETIANFSVITELLKKYRPDDYQELIVVTTDIGSPLWHVAQKESCALLEIPAKVGGRYSVFSPVGLFPLAMVGIDIEQLCAGARSMVNRCLYEHVENNPSLLSALLQFHHYQQGVNISDLFLFSVDLEAIGKWYRQLLAESIGKEYDRQNKHVLVGLTPTVSLGSIDLHSVAQLYLGGPRDKFTTFVTVGRNKHAVTVPQDADLLQGKTFAEIMGALSEGTKQAYLKNGRPFCSVVLPEKSEFYIGQFLQFKMLEIMYLGLLCNVDPFDQPNVELYKQEAYKLLVRNK